MPHPKRNPDPSGYILGICCFGMNDSCACLFKDGKVLFAAEGERYTRIKHDTQFPTEAVRDALRTAGIQGSDIAGVGFYSDMKGIPLQAVKYALRYLPHSLLFLRNVASYSRHQSLDEELKKALGTLPPVIQVKHHLAHAASTFFPSPFDKAAILTLDGTGEFTTSTFGLGEGTRVRILQEISYPHSLGKLYETFTQYLGFKPNSGEGKVMGLAPYGDPGVYAPLFRNIIHEGSEGTFRLNLDFFSFHYAAKTMYSKKLVRTLGPPRIPETPLEKRHKDISAALQQRVEEIALHMAGHLHAITGSPNLCLAGGVCLNCQMNSVVLERGPFRNLYVPPPAGDPGTAIGAAQIVYYDHAGGTKREQLESAFLGPAYAEEECRRALEEKNLQGKRLDDPASTCAELLAQGKIVGWFQGRMEIGPRALGNRSILADPRNPEMKDILNNRVKFREGFRPFAPAILEEHCGNFFRKDMPSPFMLRVYKVRPEKRDLIPAVVHVDETCRVQTVNAHGHPLLYRVVEKFHEMTDVPVVLNTSFNLRGEPIVRTPADALSTFLRSGMDALFLGNLLVLKDESVS